MGLDKGRDMGNIAIQRAPIERFQRLRSPAQFIAQSNPDPFAPVIERENSFSLH